jgi:hypothetical protein
MNSITITVLVFLGLAIIAGIAYGVYRAKFRVTEVEVNTGLVKTKMTRQAAEAAEPASEAAPPRTTAEQIAEEGGVVRKSRIEAPAEANAELRQKATGQGSRVDDSEIKLN